MLLLVLLLLHTIARESGSRSSKSSLHTILDAGAVIAELTFSFQSLSGGVLLLAFFLQVLRPDEIPQRLFA